MQTVKVDQITKVYRLYQRPSDRLREALNPFKKQYHKDYYALDAVSFDVEEGETVGIIGTNGSGKSTILKIITGVLTPTTGSVTVNGKISALLELGAGFNMEYTGIENVYLNGTMMGYTRQEMDKKLQEILDFADIGDYVYQPVKTYSSGMFVRLAFALAINVDPDILIVDEALSVGDVFFQAKCYRKIDEIRARGTTVIMVTHDMSTIIKYCNKVVLLNKGHFVGAGAPGEMVDLYKKILAGQPIADSEDHHSFVEAVADEAASSEAAAEIGENGLWKTKMTLNPDVQEYGNGRAEFIDMGLFDKRGQVTNLLMKGEEFSIRERIRFYGDIESPIFTYTFRDKMGADLTGTNTMYENVPIEAVHAGDEYLITFKQKMDLQGGDYLLSMSCTGFEHGEAVVYHRLYNVASLTVASSKNTVGVYDMNSQVEAVLKRAGEE